MRSAPFAPPRPPPIAVAAPAVLPRLEKRCPSRAREQAVSFSSRSAWLGGRFAETLRPLSHPAHTTSKIPSSSFHATYPTRSPLASPPHRTLELEPLLATKGIIIRGHTVPKPKLTATTAKKSTGPRSEEGKARVAKNASSNTDSYAPTDPYRGRHRPARRFDRQLLCPRSRHSTRQFTRIRTRSPNRRRPMAYAPLSRAWRPSFLAAAVDDQRRHLEKRCPEELRPGYDGETLLLGSAMLDRTQAFVHLARYDGHLSRRFFRAVKQLADLRRDEHKAREAPSSAGSYAPTDPYRGRYVPTQASPPIDNPSPMTGRIGFRASSESAPQPGLTQTTKQTQFRPTPVKSAPFKDEPRSADLAVEIRGLSAPPPTDNATPSVAASPHRAGNRDSRRVKASDSSVAHALSVLRRDSSRRPRLAVSGGPPAGETQPGGPSRSVLMECVRRGA